ncbi:MAG: phosphoglycerate kinase [Pseudomonadota bacterium]
MVIKYIDEFDIANKRVFIRVDFNVAMDGDGKITDDTRIRAALPTIKYALGHNAKVILASHLGRPKGRPDPKYSLKPVGIRLSELLGGVDVVMPEDCVGDGVKKLASDLQPGQVMLLENLRFHNEEKENEEEFAKKLSNLTDVYINDAFGTAHRAHASTAGMAKFVKEKGAGFLMRQEVSYLSQILKDPSRPFVALLGGAKVSDKLGVIDNLLGLVDKIVIGGGMAYTFLKASGKEIGKSLLEEDKLYSAKRILERAKARGVSIILPKDFVIANEISEDAKTEVTDNIPEDMMSLDIGPKTVKEFIKILEEAKTVFWNGPMGVFEIDAFANGTMAVAKAIANSKAISVVGGGDSIAALAKAGVSDKIKHISTGGGASLEFMEGKKLPGLAALEG